MSGPWIVFGEFKGRFFTRQEIGLGLTDPFPDKGEHAVHLYEGEITGARFEQEYRPDEYRKHGCMLLVNVPGILVDPETAGTFGDKRIYTFTQLMILDPVVVRSADLNGRTYGELTGQAYGLTESGEGIRKLGPGPGHIPPPQRHLPPDPPANGCLPSAGFGGCFSDCGSIFGWLLLLLIVMLLMRNCSGLQGQCAARDRAQLLVNQEKAKLDSVKDAYEKNLFPALLGNSTIYFYQNSTEFNLNSLGNNSPMSRVFNVIAAYEDRQFVIEGYEDAEPAETVPGLDLLRAERMRDTLVSMGISPNRLEVTGKGTTGRIDSSGRLSRFYVAAGRSKLYSPNMRVEIKPR